MVNEREKQLAKKKREKEMQKEMEIMEKNAKKRKQLQQVHIIYEAYFVLKEFI